MRVIDWCIVVLILLLVFGGGPIVSGGPSTDITIVEETAERSPAQAALWTQLQTQLPNYQVKILAKDSELAPKTSGELPVIMIFDAEGNEKHQGPCPKTLEGIKELL